MDFNKSFQMYDRLDGANCQTVDRRNVSQREAAIDAVKHIGLRLSREMDMSKFGDWKKKLRCLYRD